MNILFVLYGDFMSNSANPLALYARELQRAGHVCAVAVPSGLETVSQHDNVAFRPLLYREALASPDSVFQDGRPADVLHACTPREGVRKFISAYMAKRPTPLVIYLEDNEPWLSAKAMGLDETHLARHTEAEISEKLPEGLAHPFRYDSFIGLADAVAVIQDKLKEMVPPWVPCETVMLGIDLEFFSPRPPDPLLRKHYGVAENERVIVYHGGLNGFTKPGIETLCRAVGLINEQGYPCRLLRSGPFALDFLDQLPPAATSMISDLGLLPKQALADLLALSDIFVQPGKMDPFEDLRLPGKVPEFLAMGRPVLMPDVNISHLFREGRGAVFLHAGSAEEIAEKGIDLFSNPKKANEIGRVGRRIAEKYFDVRSQAKRLEAVYELARKHFNPVIAAELWQNKHGSESVTTLLAHKLRRLSEGRGARFDREVGAMMEQYAQYAERMQKRVEGLEAVIAEREKALQKVLSSRTWKMTRPLRQARAFFSRNIQKAQNIFKIVLAVLHRVRHGSGVKAVLVKVASVLKEEGWRGLKRRLLSLNLPRGNYAEWVRRYDTLTDEVRAIMRTHAASYMYKPLISVVMPTYNPKPGWLTEAIESVRKQIYPNWELCIADDASSDQTTRRILERYTREDSRIKAVFRERNGHISEASNSALELVGGEWVALLDHDDLLAEHALFWVADTINQSPEARLIYSDEDKIDASGRRFAPYFKCDWNIDLFYSQNLISHLGVYRTDLVRTMGGFRKEFEGSQDHDLALRYIEGIDPPQICHIPRVLYHWRMHSNSTAQGGDAKPYAKRAGVKALNDHFQRKGLNATAMPIRQGYRVRYVLPEDLPLVSLIIPTRNGLCWIRKCLESVLKKTTYQNYEILIVDNASDDSATLRYFKTLQSKPRIRVIQGSPPFNYSALSNAAVKLARGQLLGLVNNNIEVISPDWLSEMVSHALRADVGAVGARLWYPDGKLQHGGVILGIGGVAGHSHKFFSHHSHGYVGRASLIQSFSAVTSACLVIRKEVFEKVGGFNETDLQIAFNDVDFCLRVREAGYRNIWTPYAELYHHESATRGFEDTPEKKARFSKEAEYMKQRWGDLLLNDPAYSPNLTLDAEDFSLAWPPRVGRLPSGPVSALGEAPINPKPSQKKFVD